MNNTNHSHTNGRQHITPELLWSKFSVIQHIFFWLFAIAVWYGLHWLGSTHERWTIPVWRYVSRIRFYLFTADFNHAAIRGVIIGAALLFLITGVDYIVAKLKHQKPARQILRNYYLLPRTSKQRFIAVLLGINAGIFEELFFRGGVFILLLLLTGSTVFSLLITSAFFALLHTSIQGWYSTLWIFIVGLILNVLLIVTGSFYASMFCHITINLGNLLVVPSFFDEELPELRKQQIISSSPSLN